VEPSSTPFVADEAERSLVRDALLGIIAGVLAFGLLTVLVVKVGWPDQSWGFAVTIAAFTSPWAGVFFGSAAGIAYYQAKSKAHDGEGSHVTDDTTPITANA
jgi:formate/nitrite transporter FocA (FNT family)